VGGGFCLYGLGSLPATYLFLYLPVHSRFLFYNLEEVGLLERRSLFSGVTACHLLGGFFYLGHYWMHSTCQWTPACFPAPTCLRLLLCLFTDLWRQWSPPPGNFWRHDLPGLRRVTLPPAWVTCRSCLQPGCLLCLEYLGYWVHWNFSSAGGEVFLPSRRACLSGKGGSAWRSWEEALCLTMGGCIPAWAWEGGCLGGFVLTGSTCLAACHYLEFYLPLGGGVLLYSLLRSFSRLGSSVGVLGASGSGRPAWNSLSLTWEMHSTFLLSLEWEFLLGGWNFFGRITFCAHTGPLLPPFLSPPLPHSGLSLPGWEALGGGLTPSGLLLLHSLADPGCLTWRGLLDYMGACLGAAIHLPATMPPGAWVPAWFTATHHNLPPATTFIPLFCSTCSAPFSGLTAPVLGALPGCITLTMGGGGGASHCFVSYRSGYLLPAIYREAGGPPANSPVHRCLPACLLAADLTAAACCHGACLPYFCHSLPFHAGITTLLPPAAAHLEPAPLPAAMLQTCFILPAYRASRRIILSTARLPAMPGRFICLCCSSAWFILPLLLPAGNLQISDT